ncbi:hypothetical protein PSPO01_16372 [Paraphaeosphaeria sporulosa]
MHKETKRLWMICLGSEEPCLPKSSVAVSSGEESVWFDCVVRLEIRDVPLIRDVSSQVG